MNDGMPNDVHVFTPDRDVLLEAMLLLLEEAERTKQELTGYEVVKSLFIADLDHLDEHGRPITFDNYWAMEHGPVGDLAYDMLKPDFDWSVHGMTSAPWTRRRSTGRKAFFSAPRRPANRRYLSKTDVRALLGALTKVRSLEFGGVRKQTHENPAYIAAWGLGEAKAVAMDPRLLFAERDDELIAELAYASGSNR